VIDGTTREVTVGELSVRLTALEFDLLYFLASNPRQVFSRTQLYATCALAGVWTYIILDHFGVDSAWSLSAGVAVTFLTRMAAVFFDLRLPTELET